MEMDKDNAVLLVLIDLSAAFHTIDHDILLEGLSTRWGKECTALNLFSDFHYYHNIKAIYM